LAIAGIDMPVFLAVRIPAFFFSDIFGGIIF
jgi:hypothetical protein